MDRNSIYVLEDGEGSTFEFDETLPRLPLPELKDTLERYLDTLRPFGTLDELKNSKKIIQDFQNGIGADLQKKLKKRAQKQRNWLDKWWESYGYHLIRFPLQPYIAMSMPVLLEAVNVTESKENALKSASRILYYTLEFWDLVRLEKLKPASSGGGKIKYSSALFKKFFSTSRKPGDPMDKNESYFRTIKEGPTPTHAIAIGKGRIFIFECLNSDNSYLSPQQILIILQIIQATIDSSDDLGDCLPVLTHDDRTAWSKNRKYLKEISPKNRDLLYLMESSIVVISLDQHEPNSYEESSQYSLGGDFHSKWADKTSTIVAFKSGKFCYMGEHSAYDGTISVSYSFFVQLSLYENPEPDWTITPKEIPTLKEIHFVLDDKIKSEIKRVFEECDLRRNDVIVTYDMFDNFGKEFMKTHRLHPDSFIQIIIQLTYYKLHKEIAPIYETALMRNYYNGRTETLRSCTLEYVNLVHTIANSQSTNENIFNAFKNAVNHHNHMMSEARQGRAVDRHLFGLWCIAYENNFEIPELYSDPLYTKSGGGGNFVLSTSTLGYTLNSGFVAPMVLDGYGVFYSITSDVIYLQTTAFQNSTKTSARKFNKIFKETMLEMKDIIEIVQQQNSSKL